MRSHEHSLPVIIVLAGGRGSRLGGDKALVCLGGQPLIGYPLMVARAAGLDAVIVAKRTTRLPDVPFPVLVEPDEPVHPLTGVLTGLEHFESVLAVPCDMPLLTPSDLRALAAVRAEVATLVSGEPFPSLYARSAVPRLLDALRAGASMRSMLADCAAPAAGGLVSAYATLSINTVADLAAAEQRIAERD